MVEQNKTWVITPEEDPKTGEVIITFPLELLEQVGWIEDDTLNWSVRDDGSVYLTKNEKIDKTSESC
jgi:hypothetical protein